MAKFDAYIYRVRQQHNENQNNQQNTQAPNPADWKKTS